MLVSLPMGDCELLPMVASQLFGFFLLFTNSPRREGGWHSWTHGWMDRCKGGWIEQKGRWSHGWIRRVCACMGV